jgi:hypothetical protein
MFFGCKGFCASCCTSVERVCHARDRALKPCPFIQGDLSCCIACCHCIRHHCEAWCTHVDRCVNNDSRCCVVHDTTCGSCAGWQDSVAYTRIAPPALGASRVLLLRKSSQANGAASCQCSCESCGLTGSIPQEPKESLCITISQIAHTLHNLACGRSYKPIPPVGLCRAF